MDGTTGFLIDGESAYDNLGTAVSIPGDVNGDGIDDLILGSPGADKAYVIFGASGVGTSGSFDLTTLDGSNGFVVATNPYTRIGGAVSGAGDINGDGIADLLIGNNRYGDTLYLIFGGTGIGSGGRVNLVNITSARGKRINSSDN